MKEYNDEIKDIVVWEVVRGLGLREAGEKFCIPFSTVQRWCADMNIYLGGRRGHVLNHRKKLMGSYNILKENGYLRIGANDDDDISIHDARHLKDIYPDEIRIITFAPRSRAAKNRRVILGKFLILTGEYGYRKFTDEYSLNGIANFSGSLRKRFGL